jgi:hypothetical protein
LAIEVTVYVVAVPAWTFKVPTWIRYTPFPSVPLYGMGVVVVVPPGWAKGLVVVPPGTPL